MSSNIFGQFIDGGFEYEIFHPFTPPRSQLNFIWNDRLMSGLNQFGTGEGVFNSRVMMLNDPRGRVQMIQGGARYIYIQDVASGEIWNLGNFPIFKKDAVFKASVGLGYSRFSMVYQNIKAEAKVFPATNEAVEIWEIELSVIDGASREIRIVPYVEWYLGGYPMECDRLAFLRSEFLADDSCVLSENLSNEKPHPNYSAFLSTDAEVEKWFGSRRNFLGAFGTIVQPHALTEDLPSGRKSCCEDLAGALVVKKVLHPGKITSVCFGMGSCSGAEEARRLTGKTVKDGIYRKSAFNALIQRKRSMCKSLWVETPDDRINILTNIWSKHQIQLCVEFGRDGVRGFRDTLQDALAVAPFDQPLARGKIIESLSHQYSDGHTVRGWMPLRPNHYSDGPVWVALALCGYIKETGDFDFLNIMVPYLDGGEATVLDHLLCGLRHLFNDVGSHGLVLAHEGDWNDSLNWMGAGGRGESVWTSIGLYYGYGLVAELAEKVLHDRVLINECEYARKIMGAAIQEHGWDGEWYLAGYSDSGIAVGSRHTDQGQCYLNPQTWAVISGLARGERLEKCLNAVDTILESDHGSLTLSPAYREENRNVGRLTVILPGMYENGTPYCHGTAFKIVADCIANRPDKAFASYKKVQPDNENHPSISSGCEPYAFTNQYLGPENERSGDSISGWVTGTAGWMFRAVVDYMIGIQPCYDGFYIRPCLPSDWSGAKLKRSLRGKEYRFEILQKSPGDYKVLINGKESDSNFVTYY